MARWKPQGDMPVGPNEHVGRRMFDEPLLKGAANQPSWGGLDLRHFEELRGDRELSLDRLGKSGVDKSVVRYLRPKAHAAATSFRQPKKFHGWATVGVRHLDGPSSRYKFPVAPSPILTPGEAENPYHAHITIPPDEDPHIVALKLREAFGKHGILVPPTENEPEGQALAMPTSPPIAEHKNLRRRVIEGIHNVLRKLGIRRS